MIYRAIFSDRAKNELADSWKWYEKRMYGLGDRFIDAVLLAVVQLETNPEKGVVRNVKFREVNVKRFPFRVIYRIDSATNVVFIHSIFHTRRNPQKKYKE